ncbi:MAG TPA: thioredoxin family protein [Pseudolysinimonas sp.]|nr:thioredoxin family protein [Pseudolysinimonas sp.]
MNPVLVGALLVGLVALATVLGLVWQARQGRIRAGNSRIVAIDDVPLGARATLLQFSTEVCSPCVATARVLGDLAATTDHVAHVDLDVTHRPELAARYRVMQTPTTLILDAKGAIRARIGGAVRRDLVVAELDRILAA